ncbi:hypothetical protein P4679_23320 [Priestia megaterium]|uniref:hypothetical protein n=1 Tax=Priestia megaterium TaxID=1404 RepID=UPI002E24C113|nr:hypothetical protein [Priestia megaterium]
MAATTCESSIKLYFSHKEVTDIYTELKIFSNLRTPNFFSTYQEPNKSYNYFYKYLGFNKLYNHLFNLLTIQGYTQSYDITFSEKLISLLSKDLFLYIEDYRKAYSKNDFPPGLNRLNSLINLCFDTFMKQPANINESDRDNIYSNLNTEKNAFWMLNLETAFKNYRINTDNHLSTTIVDDELISKIRPVYNNLSTPDLKQKNKNITLKKDIAVYSERRFSDDKKYAIGDFVIWNYHSLLSNNEHQKYRIIQFGEKYSRPIAKLLKFNTPNKVLIEEVLLSELTLIKKSPLRFFTSGRQVYYKPDKQSEWYIQDIYIDSINHKNDSIICRNDEFSYNTFNIMDVVPYDKRNCTAGKSLSPATDPDCDHCRWFICNCGKRNCNRCGCSKLKI